MPNYLDVFNEQEFLARIIENSAEAIIGTDPEGKILSWNPAAEKLFLYPPREIIGQDIVCIIPEFKKILKQIKSKAISPDDKNIYIQNRQGAFINIKISAFPIKDNDAGLIGFSFIAHKLKPSPQAEIFKLLETIKDSIILAKLNGNIIFWNRGSYKLFGWKFEEVYDKNFIFLFESDCIPDVCKSRKVNTWEGQSRIITAAGDKKYVRVSINTIPDENMDPAFLAVVFTDISEIVEAKIQAEQAIRSKNDFLANISHEIRTPMTGILGFAELLCSDDLNCQQNKYLELIRKNAQQLMELINDVLDLSKIEAEQMTMDNKIFNTRELLKMCISNYEQEINRKSLYLDCHISPEVPQYFFGDNKRISQILSNLLANAIKFTHKGQIEITISKGTLEDCIDRFPLEFSVKDTGIGIADEKLDYIFEPFTQADSSTTRKYGGTGLGLAISKRLVGLMGGEIGVISNPDKGSEFMFTIPLLPFSGIGQELPERDGSSYNILLLIKDNIYQIIFQKILSNKGYHVTIAINEKQCKEFISSNAEYHLIFLDMDSLDDASAAIQWIRTRLVDIPIIGIRSYFTEQHSGINDYLDKPLKSKELSILAAKYCPLE